MNSNASQHSRYKILIFLASDLPRERIVRENASNTNNWKMWLQCGNKIVVIYMYQAIHEFPLALLKNRKKYFNSFVALYYNQLTSVALRCEKTELFFIDEQLMTLKCENFSNLVINLNI